LPPDGEYIELHSTSLIDATQDHVSRKVSLKELTAEGANPGGDQLLLGKGARALSIDVPSAMNRTTILQRYELLIALVNSPHSLDRLSSLCFASFGHHFLVEVVAGKSLRACLSRVRLPESLRDSYGPEAREFFRNQPSATSFSSGVCAFLSMLVVYLATDYKVFVVDEPDAFLHPPLSRKMGKLIAELSSEADACTLAATHSADFLMGAVQSGKMPTVVRLSYEAGVSDARILEPAELSAAMKEPLLRTTGVLNALFFRGALICEADSDRAFYEEINLRLRSKDLGADDCCFLNGHGKSTLYKIVNLLRRMGVPAGAAVDLDIIEGPEFVPLLQAAGVPEATLAGLKAARQRLMGTFPNGKPKNVGVAGSTDSRGLRDLIAQLDGYGIFLADVGELENWLKHLSVSAKTKTGWLVQMFEALRSDPGDPGYVHPGADDVWAFVGRVAKWVADPSRNGMDTGELTKVNFFVAKPAHTSAVGPPAGG
jgi:hypothetical protein